MGLVISEDTIDLMLGSTEDILKKMFQYALEDWGSLASDPERIAYTISLLMGMGAQFYGGVRPDFGVQQLRAFVNAGTTYVRMLYGDFINAKVWASSDGQWLYCRYPRSGFFKSKYPDKFGKTVYCKKAEYIRTFKELGTTEEEKVIIQKAFADHLEARAEYERLYWEFVNLAYAYYPNATNDELETMFIAYMGEYQNKYVLSTVDYADNLIPILENHVSAGQTIRLDLTNSDKVYRHRDGNYENILLPTGQVLNVRYPRL